MTGEATIFLVDDDWSVRRSLERLLRSAGYCVVACACAEEFLALSHTARPACLLTDVRMPGMTGLDLLDVLRTDPRDLPIILSSGDIDAATAARASGAVRFLMKPFAAEELFAAVEEALERDGATLTERT